MFAIVDCNSCYASCEQIFRPELRGKPVVVLSNNDGFIVARSKEAKLLGLEDLQPFFKVEHILKQNNVAIFSSNYPLYGDISHRVMTTLKAFSPEVEVYSIDEMFLDLSGMQEPLKQIGSTIKKTVWQNVRMPVGVGIGPTKTLAKLAQHASKKIPQTEGVCVLDQPHKWEWLQRRLPVNKVWGIGNRFARRLNDLGIETVWEFTQASPKQLRGLFNVNVERTLRELQGEPCIALEEQPPPKKQIYVTRSFGEKTSSLDALTEHISRYASAACEKLRKQKAQVRVITVFLQTGHHEKDYYSNRVVLSPPYPTNDSRLIIQLAKQGIGQIFRPHYRYARCGIGLIDLWDGKHYQGDLFEPGQSVKADKAMTVIDSINRRYGRDSLVLASEGLNGKWSMRQEHLSPAYTTSWKDLPIIECK